MEAKQDFSTLMADVLDFFYADGAEQVESLFNEYKNEHSPGLMETETTNSSENKKENWNEMDSLVTTNSGVEMIIQKNFSSISE